MIKTTIIFINGKEKEIKGELLNFSFERNKNKIEIYKDLFKWGDFKKTSIQNIIITKEKTNIFNKIKRFLE